MHRSKFPYTARSSAKVIRHAVSIDERRAKFRSDLITNTKKQTEDVLLLRGRTNASKPGKEVNGLQMNGNTKPTQEGPDRFRRRRPSRDLMSRSRTPSRDIRDHRADGQSIRSCASSYLPPNIPSEEEDEADEATPQDVEELWFPGGHGDLGGGWELE